MTNPTEPDTTDQPPEAEPEAVQLTPNMGLDHLATMAARAPGTAADHSAAANSYELLNVVVRDWAELRLAKAKADEAAAANRRARRSAAAKKGAAKRKAKAKRTPPRTVPGRSGKPAKK